MANIAPVEFSIIRGTTETLYLGIYATDGTVVDLTGNSSMNLYVAPTINTTSPTLTKALTVRSGYPTTSGAVTCSFAPNDTSALTPGEYIAEVHITYSNTNEYRSEQPFTFKILERVKT